MIRTIFALLLLCSVTQAQTVTRQGAPATLYGSGAPSPSVGLPNQIYFDLGGHRMWRRTGTGWTELGLLSTPTNADILTVAGPSLNGFYMGVNYSGLEGGNVPGTAYVDYSPPRRNDFDYLASRGLKVVRLPILWERVQPTLMQPLDPTYLAFITSAASYAATKGMGLLIDVHNYGGYGGNNIGTTQTPVAAFADLWSRLAAALYNQPGVTAYDLMNEPVSLGANLQPAMQAAVTAIRAYDTTHPILVEGDGYSGAGSWTGISENNTFAISDPASKIIYEAHNYLDCDSSGTHGNWTAQGTNPTLETGGTSCNSGMTVTVNTGLQRATTFVNWCIAHGYRCMIGEVGAPNSDPHWQTSLDNEISYLRTNNIGVTYFAAGSTFGSYFQGVQIQSPGQQPGDLADTPSMGVLEKYAGFTAIPYTIYGPRTGASGTAATFNVVTNGYIATPTTITPNDGGAGGTFAPTSVTLAAGFGGSGSFTYTAHSNATFRISATASNPAWVNPQAIGFSTARDLIAIIAGGSGATPLTILSSTSAVNSTYVAPVLTLRRASDNTTQSFGYTAAGAIDTTSIAAWAGGAVTYLHGLADTAPGVTNSLGPVTSTADEPVWSATALNGRPAYILNNSRLQTVSDISGRAAITVVATVALPNGSQCNRLLAWEFTSSWLVPGKSGWWDNSIDTPMSVGTLNTTGAHVLVMRWQGQGTGTGLRDLFVDGMNVSSTATTSAILQADTGPTGIGNMLYMGWFRFYSPCSTNGVVGDVMVFNGALSDAEVAVATAHEKTKFRL